MPPAWPRLYVRSRVVPFVVLFIERDGSTYLTSLLSAHPDVQAVYERFSVMRQKGQSGAEQLAWARSYFSPPLVGRAAAIGFKTKLVDVLDRDGFARLLRERECRILHMRRLNHVKAVVSRINARRLHDATGHWNLYASADRMPPMVIDPEEFDRFLEERGAAERELETFLRDLHLPTLRLVYEDLLVDREAVLAQVFSFLRLSPARLAGRTLKHTPDDLRHVVLNFDDLRRRYSDTIYEPMFGEVLQPAPERAAGRQEETR